MTVRTITRLISLVALVAIDPRSGEALHIGKRNLQDIFCIAIAGNWPRCRSSCTSASRVRGPPRGGSSPW